MKRHLIIAAGIAGFLAVGILSAFEYQQIDKQKSQIATLLQETSDLRTHNQDLLKKLEKLQNQPHNNLPSNIQTVQSSLPPKQPSALSASTADPNTAVAKETKLSPQALELIQNTLRQIRQKKTAPLTDVNDLTPLQRENELLKQEIARLVSQLNLQQSSQTVLSEIQTEKQQTESILASVVSELGANPNPTQKIKLLESLTELSNNQEPALLPIIQQGLSDPNPEVRLAAMGLLKDYQGSDALPLLSAALDLPDTEIRLEAVDALDNFTDPAVANLFLKAMNDQEEEIRTAVLGKTDNLSDDVLLPVYGAGIKSPYADVKTETLSLLEFRGDQKSVPFVIEALNDSNPEIVETANSTLSFLLDQEFKNYKEAKAWWAANKAKYDENLSPISDP